MILGPKIWNLLPDSLRTAKSLRIFALHTNQWTPHTHTRKKFGPLPQTLSYPNSKVATYINMLITKLL